jgi:hypothetical protein
VTSAEESAPGTRRWSTFVLPTKFKPRFRGRCHFCGCDRSSGSRRLRVLWTGRGERDAASHAPRHVLVPSCRSCAWRSRLLLVLVLVACLTMVGAGGARWQKSMPGSGWRKASGLVAMAIALTALFRMRPKVDIVEDQRGLHWSFKLCCVADDFATDNCPEQRAAPE